MTEVLINHISQSDYGHEQASEMVYRNDQELVHSIQSNEIIGLALCELDTQPVGIESLYPMATVLTTNEQVVDRQVRLVRASHDGAPISVYMKLHNWADNFEATNADLESALKFTFESVGQGTLPYSDYRAITRDIDGMPVSFIYSEYAETLDGLVTFSLPEGLDQQTSANQLDTVLTKLTGQGLWDESLVEQSMIGWKIDAYRNFHKLPEGPLTIEQQQAAVKLEIHPSAKGRISLISPGQHEQYTSRYTGEVIRPFHQVARLENAINIISDGSIDSTLARLERGYHKGGRSSHTDMMTGGGDVVFTYASTRPSGISFSFCPEVLDRIDVRAYNEDAYGSMQLRGTQRVVDRAIERPRRNVVTDYSERLQPDEFSQLGGVHELCFEGGLSLTDCEALQIVDGGESSFYDYRWEIEFMPFVPEHVRYKGNAVSEMASRLKELWGDEKNSRDLLTSYGLPEQRVVYLTAGMNLPLRQRIIAKLQILGINDISGRSLDDFIIELES